MKKLIINKWNKLAIAGGMFILGATSCSKTLDINVDPNNYSDVPVATLLPSAEVNIAFSIGGNGTRVPASFVQLYSGHRNQPLQYGQYNVSPSSTDNLWSSLYAGALRDLVDVIGKSRAKGDSMYVGVGQLLTAYTFGYLTDMYGDIPYSDALKDAASITPAYDKQQNIYPALISMIEAGVANVKSGTGTKPGSEDVIYGGIMANWEKFGNSLKLRLLNHLSKVQPTAAADFLATNPNLISANTETAKLVFGTTQANANPIYSFDELSGRKDNAVASTIVDKMKAIDPNDARIAKYFNPVKNNTNGVKGQFIGNVPGGDNDDAGEAKFSRVGPAFAANGAPVILLSNTEVKFITAEVKFRQGDNIAAATAYNAALDADFDFVGSGSYATTYKALPTVVYNSTLQRIMEQKWIVMMQAPYEAWTDWRRTGIPALTAASTNFTDGVIPRRLPYPQLEINLNSNSLKNGPGIPVPYESLKAKVWWDQ